MKPGFLITCLQCGAEHSVVPGKRNYRKEQIVFGTDNYGSDQISCECGNALEEHSQYEGTEHEEFVVEWRDISKPKS